MTIEHNAITMARVFHDGNEMQEVFHNGILVFRRNPVINLIAANSGDDHGASDITRTGSAPLTPYGTLVDTQLLDIIADVLVDISALAFTYSSSSNTSWFSVGFYGDQRQSTIGHKLFKTVAPSDSPFVLDMDNSLTGAFYQGPDGRYVPATSVVPREHTSWSWSLGSGNQVPGSWASNAAVEVEFTYDIG